MKLGRLLTGDRYDLSVFGFKTIDKTHDFGVITYKEGKDEFREN